MYEGLVDPVTGFVVVLLFVVVIVTGPEVERDVIDVAVVLDFGVVRLLAGDVAVVFPLVKLVVVIVLADVRLVSVVLGLVLLVVTLDCVVAIVAFDVEPLVTVVLTVVFGVVELDWVD